MSRSLLTAACLALLLPPVVFSRVAPDQDLNATRSIAESQHEIVMILIRKKEFDEAGKEAAKIFKMDWSEDKEPLLLKELLGLADKFLENKRPDIALKLLTENMGAFRQGKSEAAIWKEKGYLLKGMGKDDEALECFRQAQRLEKKVP
jgi:tetratricopeptide (TPR) repeat protein